MSIFKGTETYSRRVYDMASAAGIVPSLYVNREHPNGLDSLTLLPLENWKVLANADFDEDFWCDIHNTDDFLSMLESEGFLEFTPYFIDTALYNGKIRPPLLAVSAFKSICIYPMDDTEEGKHHKRFYVTKDAWDRNRASYWSSLLSHFDPGSVLAASALLQALLEVVAICPQLLKESNHGIVADFYQATCRYLGVKSFPDREDVLEIIRAARYDFTDPK